MTYLAKNAGVPEDMIDNYNLFEGTDPWALGRSAAYVVGYLSLIEIRERAEEALGEAFDIKEFHHVILVNGPMPLLILE